MGVPDGYEEIINPDVNERLQAGDLMLEEDDWIPITRVEVGTYIAGFRAARPKPKPTAIRVMRRRAAK